MSDFSIPGTASDKYGTQKLIDGLMKVERIPRDKEADAIKALETQKTVWLDFNQKLGTLRQGAQDLYNFKNPFNTRIAKSSDDEVLTATATREALEQDRTILVKRAAAADRLVSSELAKDYKVAAGDYAFTVGDKRVDLKFGGGSLQDFADALTRKGGDLLRAQVVARRTDTKSLVIESLKTGGTSRLGFDGDAVKLALDAGLVERVSTSRQELDPAKAVRWDNPMDSTAVRATVGALSLTAGGEAKLGLNPQSKTAGMVLEIEYRMTRLPREQAPSPPLGPSLGAVGSATYEGITVTGAPSASGLPDWVPPPAPPLSRTCRWRTSSGPTEAPGLSPTSKTGMGRRSSASSWTPTAARSRPSASA